MNEFNARYDKLFKNDWGMTLNETKIFSHIQNNSLIWVRVLASIDEERYIAHRDLKYTEYPNINIPRPLSKR